MERDRAMVIVERHQPSVLWWLLRIRRCAYCRHRWPCEQYLRARTALVSHDRQDIAAIIHGYTRRCAP